MHTSGEVEEGPARKGVVRVKETTNDAQLGGQPARGRELLPSLGLEGQEEEGC